MLSRVFQCPYAGMSRSVASIWASAFVVAPVHFNTSSITGSCQVADDSRHSGFCV